MFTFFQLLTLDYGPSITHPSLRQAVCAFTCSRLPQKEFVRELEYTQLACNALARRLQTPPVIDEGDLFTAVLLVKLVRWHGGDYLAQIEGVLALMEHLYHKAGGDISKYTFAKFWPMMRDEIMVFLPRDVCLRFSQATHQIFGLRTFQEYASYQDGLLRNGTWEDSWFKTLVGSWQRLAWVSDCRALRSQASNNEAYIKSVSDVVSAAISAIDEKSIMAWYTTTLESLDRATDIKDIVRLQYRLHEVMFGIMYDRLSNLSLADLQAESALRLGERLERAIAGFSRCFAFAHLLNTARNRVEQGGCSECVSETEEGVTFNHFEVRGASGSIYGSSPVVCVHGFREKQHEILRFFEHQLEEIKMLKGFIETEFSWAKCPQELELSNY
jgi:hypothetical protein